ncbi:hypothetical protein [Coprococcus comes]|uniref:hypothetical protein n=1 Tax=Coprococcus comes TaxID=410072 RepID=UPI001896F6C4|nr:hypothetical protein [Coprococcus comes]
MAQGKGNPEINKKVATSALVTLLVSVVGFYLGNRYWEAVASLGGQFFEHWGDGFALMWPLIADTPTHLDMSPNAMLAGLTMCSIVWLFWLRYLAFVGNFRAGEESGSARWGTLKEGKQFRDEQQGREIRPCFCHQHGYRDNPGKDMGQALQDSAPRA